MKAPEWAKAVEVDTVIETWDGVYAETERELTAAAPNARMAPITLDRIWGKLSQDARDNLYELTDCGPGSRLVNTLRDAAAHGELWAPSKGKGGHHA